jgi:hypothetical protein
MYWKEEIQKSVLANLKGVLRLGNYDTWKRKLQGRKRMIGIPREMITVASVRSAQSQSYAENLSAFRGIIEVGEI